MRLSRAQTRVLNQMEPNKWYSAYTLQCSVATLEAMRRKGFVRMKMRLGALFSPRVNILFQKVRRNKCEPIEC